ncbi:MAG: hypothetical protein KDD42_04195, partial [Bdellovibrionales bacterium]|nr:hypothetical protein [Bdellovibrionales bacterium]
VNEMEKGSDGVFHYLDKILREKQRKLELERESAARSAGTECATGNHQEKFKNIHSGSAMRQKAKSSAASVEYPAYP